MKNVYFAQPSNKLPGSVYLPYSVGAIAAYSWQFEEIRSEYRLSEFIFMQEDISEVIERIENPYLVGFSCYMWNTEYNLSLAREIKKRYPECITVFGGPDVPENADYIEKYDFIDITMCSEGETIFKSLLSALSNNLPLDNVKNISFRKDGNPFSSEREVPGDISDFPSPYTTGVFDEIINNPRYSDLHFDVVFETNRGCPYSCVFCYWGYCNRKFRTFPIEKVKAEIDWFVRNKIGFCFCADGNFGMLERDEEIADYIIEQNKIYGYPLKLESIAAKNKNERVFRINHKLSLAGLNNGVSIACQSLSPTVLEIIGRQNMSFEELKNTFHRYHQAKIPTYTDLILGLPGDTYESFCESLLGVMEAGQHNIIQVLPFEMLPNTIMNSPEFIEKYAVKTVKSKLCLSKAKCGDTDSMGSRSEIVVENSTMSRNDWRNAFRLSTLVQGFHCMSILAYVAVYLRREKNISYHNFYTSLYNWSEENDTFIKSVTDRVCRSLDPFLEGKGNLGFTDELLGDVFWQFQEGQFLFAALNIDKFFDEIRAFAKRFDPDKDAFEDVLRYQKEMIVTPDTKERFIDFKYNWKAYFEDICDTAAQNPQPCATRLHFKEKKFKDIKDYAEKVVWKGKRQKKMLSLDAEAV